MITVIENKGSPDIVAENKDILLCVYNDKDNQSYCYSIHLDDKGFAYLVNDGLYNS